MTAALTASLLLAGIHVTGQRSGAGVASAFTASQLTLTINSQTVFGYQGTVFARCPSGTVGLGGGGEAWADFTTNPFLTQLEPFSDGFRASGNGQGLFAGDPWHVTAYAICGPAPAGLEYITRHGANSTATFQQLDVRCSPGKRVLSAGARVRPVFPDRQARQLGLYLVRPDGPLTIARASALSVAPGSPPWSLNVKAVCAFPLANQQNAATVAHNDVLATQPCPAGTFVHGAGGGGGLFWDGNYWLKAVTIDSGFRRISVVTTDTPGSFGIVAQATCAN